MFVPRSVRISTRGTESTSSTSIPTTGKTETAEVQRSEKKEAEDEEDSSDDDDEVVLSYSKLQRWPEPGEPVCVVCGRYGAYIVDKTDHDVCSLECKARHLLKLGIPLTPGGSATPPSTARGKEGEWSYQEHLEVVQMTQTQVEGLRSKMRIKVKGNLIPKPVSSFSQLNLPEKVMANLESAGYSDLTPVQMQVIPAALQHRNLLVCAATGTGKTLSFILPVILRLLQRRGHGDVAPPAAGGHRRFPRCLILAPTRELAMQIEEQTKEIMKGLPQMRTALVVGGMPIANQLHRLKSGVEVLVGTPARLNDIIENHPWDIELCDVEIFVVDEVDCLFSMGFEQQVRAIEEMLPAKRQDLMFSATVPAAIERMARGMMKEPIFLTIGEPGMPCDAIRHTVLWVEEASKKKKLLEFFRDGKHFNPPAVVFVSSKKGSLLLADSINKSSIPAATAVGLHGDMTQDRRSAIVQEFLDGKHSVLVATNIVARGIDLLNVQQVFIFDMPSSVLDFIHQVGRAGRMGCPGNAVTFINNSNKNIFLKFAELLGRVGVALPPQLVSSPYLALQREERKAKQSATSAPPSAKRKKTAA